MNDDDKRLLRIAYNEAKLGFEEGGCPIGSVLARGAEIVSQGRNQRVQKGDPIAHGEMDALRKAGRQKNLSRYNPLYFIKSLHDVYWHYFTVWHSKSCHRRK